VLNLRPPAHWLTSIDNWHRGNSRFDQSHRDSGPGGLPLRERFVQCNITGLPAGAGTTDAQMIEFYQKHSQRIRDHVRTHPTHRLVEVDIEDPVSRPQVQQSIDPDPYA
jgi:hypothetical protein